jgi:hypothetical protein
MMARGIVVLAMMTFVSSPAMGETDEDYFKRAQFHIASAQKALDRGRATVADEPSAYAGRDYASALRGCNEAEQALNKIKGKVQASEIKDMRKALATLHKTALGEALQVFDKRLELLTKKKSPRFHLGEVLSDLADVAPDQPGFKKLVTKYKCRVDSQNPKWVHCD